MIIDDPNPRIDKLSKLDYQELVDLYKRVFTTGDGALVLEHMKGIFFEYTPPEASTPHQMGVNVGKQSVIIHIKNMLIQSVNKPEGIEP